MTEDAPEEIRVDWRTRVAATIAKDYLDPDTGQSIPSGSVMTVDTIVKHGEHEIRFADPSAVALFLNQSFGAYGRAMSISPFAAEPLPISRLERDVKVYDYLEEITASVLFAFTTIEAFANEETPEDFFREQLRDDGVYVARDKGWIERWTSLSEKLSSILPKATGRPSPKGLKVWQDYVMLKRIRNRIVHLKTRDRARSKADDLNPESLWKDLLSPQQPDYPLIAKNMILHFRPDRLKGCPF